MTIAIRPADLRRDRGVLLGVLERNLPEQPHADRFDWLYHDNPAGPAMSWLAVDGRADAVVGTASLFPRTVWIGGALARCGQVGDFAIDASHRTLGPALMLQRATFTPVTAGALSFCYDCPPHERGMSTFRRLGMQPTLELHRYTKLLRTRGLAQRWLGPHRIVGGVARLGDGLLAALDALRHRARDVEVAPHDGPFGEEFARLDAATGPSGAIRARRGVEELTWRYRRHPLRHYRILAARQGGALRGFTVYGATGTSGNILDLFAPDAPEAAGALLHAAATELRARGAETLRAFTGVDDALARVLRRHGFVARPATTHVVVYTAPDTAAHHQLQGRPEWAFTLVDIAA